MSDVNKTILMGRLVRNAETKTTPDGLFIANFSIATNRSVQNKDGTWTEVPHFFNHTLYGNRAKALSPYLIQGQLVIIEGHLIQRRWEKDGKKFQRMENAIEDIKLVSRPQNNTENKENKSAQEGNEPDINPLDASAFSHTNETPDSEEFTEPMFEGDIF